MNDRELKSYQRAACLLAAARREIETEPAPEGSDREAVLLELVGAQEELGAIVRIELAERRAR